MMSNAKSAVSTGIANVITFFSQLPSKVLAFIKSLASDLVSKFKDMFTNAKTAVTNGVDNIVSAIKNFGTTFLNSGKGLLDSFVKGIKNGIGNAVKAVSDGMKKVREFLPFSPAKKGALSDLDKSGESFFPTWYNGALKQVRPMTRAIGGAMASMNNELQSGYGEVASFTGGRSSMKVTVTHEVAGKVEVTGDNGKESFELASQQVKEQFNSSDVLGGLRQAIRKR